MSEENLNGESFNTQENYENPGVYSAPSPTFVTYIPYGYTPKTFKEKNEVKKSALMVGLSLIIMLGVSLVWSFAYILIMKALGFTRIQASEFISDPAVMQVLQVVLSSFMFTVPFIAIFKANGERISDLVPLKKPEKGNRAAMYMLGVSFCAFANIANSYAGEFFRSIGINYDVDFGDEPRGLFGFLLSLIATAIVPGLVEEFACRGLILGRLRKHGDGFAVLASSIIFGLMHGNFDQMPFAFAVGLILGFITVKTGTLWISMAVHATNNLISVLFTYFLDGFTQQAQNLIYTVYLMAALILGIFALVLLKDKDTFKFGKCDNESKLNQRCKWFFLSPAIVIFTVVCVLESLMYFKL